MLSRRGLGKAAAMGSFGAFGGLPPQRPDQIHTPRGPALGAGPRSIGPQPFVVIFGTGPRRGLFVYSGPPAFGKLILSVTGSAGMDKYGNATLAGEVTYRNDGVAWHAGQDSGGTTAWYTAASPAGPWTVVGQLVPFGGLSGSLELEAITGPINIFAALSTVVIGDAALPVTSAAAEIHGTLQAGNGLSIGQGLGFQTLVNGSMISTAGITQRPVTAAASVTGIILQAGTFDGQFISLPSDAAGGVTITFAAAATSHVKTGVATVIQPGSCLDLRWVAATSLWYPVQ